MKEKSRTKMAVLIGVALLLIALTLPGACGKETVKEVPVEKVVEKEVVKEVPVEKVVEKEVVKEVPVERLSIVPVARSIFTSSPVATFFDASLHSRIAKPMLIAFL